MELGPVSRFALAAALPLLACGSSGATAIPDGAGAGPADAMPDPRCAEIPLDATFTASLRITTDDECEVFVNGASVGSTTSWPSPVTLDVSLDLHPSRENVVAIRASNLFEQDGNDRGIVGELAYLVDDVAIALVVTDAAWRTSPTAEDGWTELGFDDSDWLLATEVASHGDPPWGGVLTTTGAKWIWTAPVPVSAADKEAIEPAHARRRFYFGFDGATLADQPGCP